jgi:threonine/homoserine/homoserine lactone efflux protein
MGIHLWAFLGISLVVIIAPGPDTVVVTKNALMHGRGAALGTSLGVNTGLLIWTIAAAVGVAALVRESAVAFTTLKVVGAVYLIWLGVQALRAARHPSAFAAAGGDGGAMTVRLGFRQGLLSDLANPKIGVFFTSLLPQFVSGREPVLVPAKISDVLTRPGVKAALDRVTCVVLIGLGVRLALERR